MTFEITSTEKNFLLNQKDFFSETTVKCPPKKDSNLRLLQTMKNGILTVMNTVLKFRMPCNLIL